MSYENNCHDVSNVYKYLNMINKGDRFWSIKPALTYNKPIIMVTSSRSIGKSTNIACFLLFDFLLNGFKFIYLRRTRDEMLETCKDYFNNAIALINENTEFKILSVEYKAGDYFIKLDDDNPPMHCGYAMGLSLESKYKSKPFDNVGTVLYDEFLPKDRNKYLGSIEKDPDKEPRLFNSLYASVDREIGKAFKSSTRIILSGNTETIYNPFFIAWGVTPYLFKDEKAKCINPKSRPWVLQRIKKVAATAGYETTILYAISTDSDKGYNFENNGGDDFNQDWILKVPKGARHMAFLKLEGSIYKLSRSGFDIFISKYSGTPHDRIISLDFSSFASQDFGMVKKWNNDMTLVVTREAFLRGNLYFDSVNTKRLFTNYLNLV